MKRKVETIEMEINWFNAMKRDAMRYQWLKSRAWVKATYYKNDLYLLPVIMKRWANNQVNHESFDEAIDAEMADNQ